MDKKFSVFIASIFFLISLMSFTSADIVGDWKTYGNSISAMWNEQYTNGIGKFNMGVSSNSITAGYSSSFTYGQPLVTWFEPVLSNAYLILPVGTYLQIYDKNLNLLQEINTGGNAVSQLDTMGFLQTESKDIIGIWNVNSSRVAFRVYTYYNDTNTFNKSYEYFLDTADRNFAGLRHSANKVYFLFTNSTNIYFTTINSSAITMVALPSWLSGGYTKPLAWEDVNADGKVEYFTSSASEVIGFQNDGTVIFDYNKSTDGTGDWNIEDFKIYKPDATNQWKIVILEGKAYYTYPNNYAYTRLTAKKNDGTAYWTDSWYDVQNYAFVTAGQNGRLAISNDYDGDAYNDIFVAITGSNFYGTNTIFAVLKGSSGSPLATEKHFAGGGTINDLTIADMNDNNYEDFILASQSSYRVYDIHADNSILYDTTGFTSCVPADINIDGFQEISCSGSANTTIFSSNYSNQNPTINSVSYSPSISVVKFTTINAVVNAVDTEGNTIYYKSKCSNDLNWSSTDNNAVRSCYYADIGFYNLTIAVKDDYHADYNSFSQMITVTDTGTVCGNGICETGENTVNCPSDCPSNVTTTQATDTGGMAIPVKIVDVNNVEQGLLPEIYYGILGFLSNTLSPMIILVFFIFFVLIILSLGFIIKKIAKKVGELSR